MYDVLCIGKLTSCDIIFSGLKEMPKKGTEIFCDDFKITAGGCANTPIALSKLGINATLLTMIGNDIAGNIIYGVMESNGLDMSEVIVDDSYNTCVSAVLSTNGNRGFATYYNNSKTIEKETVQNAIKNCKYVFSDLGTCLEWDEIIYYAKKYEKKIFMDMGWMEDIDLNKTELILRNVDVFSPNESEALKVTGSTNIEDALDILSSYVNIAIIKRGTKGSVAKSGNRNYSIPARSEFEEIDTTGAGDLFNAGLIYGILNGWDIDRCLKMGNLTGGFSVTFLGGVDRKFTITNLKKYIDF